MLLSTAVDDYDVDTIKKLLINGADPNTYYFNSCNTLLNITVGRNCLKIVKILLKHGADPNLSHESQTPPIIWAVFNINIEMVEVLLNHNANPNIEDTKWGNVLIRAIIINNMEMVKLLLEYGADPNFLLHKYKHKRSPIICAVHNNNIEMVKLLLEYYTNPSPSSMYDNTVILIADSNNNIELIKLLIYHGVNIDDTPEITKITIDQCENKESKQILSEWWLYLPKWSTTTHHLYPKFIKKEIRTWLLVNKQLKVFPKDMVFFIAKILSKIDR